MSGAGWTLKSGELNLNNNFIFQEIFEEVLNKKFTTSYKLLLLKFILESIIENRYDVTFEEIYRGILDNFYMYFYKYKDDMNQKSRKSSLYILLKEKNIRHRENLQDIKIKELDFLSSYVLGALYNDTKGNVFGFSKNDKKIILNTKIKDEISTEVLLRLNQKLVDDLGVEEIERNEIREFKEKVVDRIENVKEEKGNYYQQKFALEVNYILNNLVEIYREDNKGDSETFFEKLKNKTREEVADELGIGEPKLQAQLQYMKILNLLDKNDKTVFTEKISKMNANHDYIEPLLYYYLVKSKRDGGHYIYSELVNEVIYRLFNDEFEFKVSSSKLLEKMEEFNIDNLKEKNWKSMTNFAINSLINSELGFGKMGLLEEVGVDKKNIIYEIHSYWVEPLVGAYIIYDLWKDGQTAMPINSLINDKYSLGRIFLMDQEAVIETLEEIKALGLIDINLTAGLNQIVKSSKYTKEDILDMMIKNS